MYFEQIKIAFKTHNEINDNLWRRVFLKARVIGFDINWLCNRGGKQMIEDGFIFTIHDGEAEGYRSSREIKLSKSEIEKSTIEWSEYLIQLQNEYNNSEQEKIKLEKEKAIKEKRELYNKLKEEFNETTSI